MPANLNHACGHVKSMREMGWTENLAGSLMNRSGKMCTLFQGQNSMLSKVTR
jgi:hypothetical protein